MIVLKFGGTSVGSAKSIRQVVSILDQTAQQKIVVLSAFSGVTNILVELCEAHSKGLTTPSKIEALKTRCLEVINELFEIDHYRNLSILYLQNTLEEIEKKLDQKDSQASKSFILAQGELISTHVFKFFLNEKSRDCELIQALDFMRINEGGEPDYQSTAKLLKPLVSSEANLMITQGFICRDQNNEISNLQRGGSDYSASIIGNILDAEEIQIWTDIDGMHNNDPRFVSNTFSVAKVSFDEAAELAYFGAKILHPQSLLPAKEKGIAVRLKNTFQPELAGTLIQNEATSEGVTSIAAKDGITAIKIKSYRMLMAYGFLKKVFEVFETYKTPIDMITTSEVAVSLTIDNDTYLNPILEELNILGHVEIDSDLSIICIAGNFSQDKVGSSTKIFKALQDIPVRMISYGGSNYNISLLVKTSHKAQALNSLNSELFRTKLNALV